METEQDQSKGLPLIGEPFPAMNVKSTHGRISIPDDFKGRWIVLFSHPADFTPVCTTEFVAFQKHAADFSEMGCQLIGLSIDQVFSHIKWVEWIKEHLDTEITFPIIADDQGKIAKRLGMLHANQESNTVRAVFVIDDQGTIRLILYYPQEVGRNIDEVLRAVRALQASTKNNVAIPADWPNNTLIGDHVITPPATDVKTAMERRGKDGCYDWWFCHGEL
ncbi:MAG: peroxiredoxin [Nanoarchaeota archaeon]